eukprot:jgi/Botrbrau1/11877/Bobra.126_2s0012.1
MCLLPVLHFPVAFWRTTFCGLLLDSSAMCALPALFAVPAEVLQARAKLLLPEKGLSCVHKANPCREILQLSRFCLSAVWALLRLAPLPPSIEVDPRTTTFLNILPEAVLVLKPEELKVCGNADVSGEYGIVHAIRFNNNLFALKVPKQGWTSTDLCRQDMAGTGAGTYSGEPAQSRDCAWGHKAEEWSSCI